MLHELDTALRALVEREIGEDADVEIDFDAPTKDWASHRNRPTIDIYLYDIRQDTSRYQFGMIEQRDGDRLVTARRPHRFARRAGACLHRTHGAPDVGGLPGRVGAAAPGASGALAERAGRPVRGHSLRGDRDSRASTSPRDLGVPGTLHRTVFLYDGR